MAKRREVRLLPTVHEETEEDEQEEQEGFLAYTPQPLPYTALIEAFIRQYNAFSDGVNLSNPADITAATAVPITSNAPGFDCSALSFQKSYASAKAASLTSNRRLLSVPYPVPQYKAEKIITVADLIEETINKLQAATTTKTVAEQFEEAIHIAKAKAIAKMPRRKREASDSTSDATPHGPMFNQEFMDGLIPNSTHSPMTREIFKTNTSLLESLDMETHVELLKGLNAHYIARYRKSKTGTMPVRDLIDEAFENVSDVKLDTLSVTQESQQPIMELEGFIERVSLLAKRNNRNWEEALEMVREANKPAYPGGYADMANEEQLEASLHADEYKLSQESVNGDSVGDGAKGEKKKKKKKKKSKKGGKGKQGMEAESQDVATGATALDDAYAAVEAELAAT